MNKKGQFGNLQGMVISLVTIGIIIGVCFLVMAEFKTNITDNTSQAWKGVNTTEAAMSKIPQWLGIIVILGIVGIIMSIIFSVFPRQGGAI